MATAVFVPINDGTPALLATGPGNITITSPYAVYIGGSAVDATDGFPVTAGVIFPVQLGLAALQPVALQHRSPSRS